jgi:hypothetical protein
MVQQPPVALEDGRQAKVIRTNEGGYKYAVEVSGGQRGKETWYISEPRWFYDQFKNGFTPQQTCIVLWKRNPDGTADKQTQISIPASQHGVDTYLNAPGVKDRYKPLFNFAPGRQPTLNAAGLSIAIDKAIADRTSETEDPSNIKQFDLPKDAPIGYIGIAHRDPKDVVTNGAKGGSNHFAELLKKCGYDIRCGDRGPLTELTKDSPTNPAVLLASQVDSMYKKDIRTIYINLDGHGLASHVELGSGAVTAENLRALFDAYQDCNFVVNTMACFGGGLERAVWSYEDPSGKEGRVRLFLGSQISTFGMEGRVVDKDNPYDIRTDLGVQSGSYYQTFLFHYLQEGMTYGQAHVAADQKTKEYLGVNPQTWRSTGHGGEQTAETRPTLPQQINPESHIDSGVGAAGLA